MVLLPFFVLILVFEVSRAADEGTGACLVGTRKLMSLQAQHVVEKTLRFSTSSSPAHNVCRWNVSAPHGKAVRVRLTGSYQIPSSSQCDVAYVKFTDPAENRTFTFCGGRKLPTFTSSTNQLTVETACNRKSYYYSCSRSFNFNYLAVSPPPKVNVTKAEKCLSEGVTLTEPSGAIRSPVGLHGLQSSDTKIYTGLYAKNQQCTWHIKAPQGQKVTLNFTAMDMDARDSGCSRQPTCLCDYVEVWDPLINNRTRFCYGLSRMTSSGHEVYVSFVTNSDKEYGGFKLTYWFTSPPQLPNIHPRKMSNSSEPVAWGSGSDVNKTNDACVLIYTLWDTMCTKKQNQLRATTKQ